MSFMENYLFLKKKYPDLSSSKPVESAAKRTEARTGEKVPPDPSSRIQNYLDRFREITDRKDPAERKRGLEAIKRILYRDNIIKPTEVPESYFESIKRRHREEGHGDIEIPDEIRKELTTTLITDQESSLDSWIDYLASDDAKYPDDLKYWTIRSILKMGRFDKNKNKFTERYGATVSPFPDINREALAYILDAVEKKYKGASINFPYDIQEDERQKFNQFLQGENFPKLYAFAIEQINPISKELLEITQGKWVKYPKGSDYKPLTKSLGRKGTGWCIAGEAM